MSGVHASACICEEVRCGMLESCMGPLRNRVGLTCVTVDLTTTICLHDATYFGVFATCLLDATYFGVFATGKYQFWCVYYSLLHSITNFGVFTTDLLMYGPYSQVQVWKLAGRVGMETRVGWCCGFAL